MFGWVLNTSLLNMSLDRSSFLNVFYKKVVLKKFHKIHTKTPVPQACNFIKKEALAQEFPVNFVKFLRTSFFIEQLCWLLLAIKGLKGNKIQELQPSSKFVTEVLIFRRSRSRMFFKIGALKKFAIFTGKHLCWPLQTFFYRTAIVTASTFSRQQIAFSGEPGIYC